MQLFDVCTKREYEKDGEKKVKWYRAGILKITESGSQYLRLFQQPQNDLYIFERKPQENTIQLEEQ